MNSANGAEIDMSLAAVKTWRYLRLAIIGLVVGLAASVLYERSHAPGCFQTSISAYYYTPAGVFFICALMAVGISMFCLRGSTEPEDISLNLAGMAAPVIAFVPTPNRGICSSANTIDDPLVEDGIVNSMNAYFVLGLFVVLVLTVLVLHKWQSQRDHLSRSALLGFVIALLVGLVTAVIFYGNRTYFLANAHNAAAVFMFVCIAFAVVTNARGTRKVFKYFYWLIVAGMIVVALATWLAGKGGWDHWVLGIETGLIALFAIFWIVQTADLWNEGLRASSGDSGRLEGQRS